jgi:hypothetical protein
VYERVCEYLRLYCVSQKIIEIPIIFYKVICQIILLHLLLWFCSEAQAIMLVPNNKRRSVSVVRRPSVFPSCVPRPARLVSHIA